ncbi:sugar phosphate isomerase/epimerase [Armatimonas sp.]|uniref:sugar phosphate isomerase/epimerase family protein n=1 Tax=Armatimonas sp. TaxID=1872638 RepID=UPI00286A3CF7|nr:sugar phosphate isomerase/epimerase [Armatimonas sp.]
MTLGFLTDGRVEDVAFAAAEGFDCLELALFGDTPLLDDSTAFQAALKEHKIALSAVSLFGQNYFDEATGAERLVRLERVIALTAVLGAPIVVFGSGSGAVTPTAAIRKLLPLIHDAQQLGLTAAFYNCHWENIVDRPAAWDEALPLASGVGIKFDPSHPIQLHRDWKSELHHAGAQLKHAHTKDVLEVGGKFVTDPNPGLGSIRWEEFFGLLYHIHYEGAVCIEPHSQRYTGPQRYDFLKLSRDYLRRFLV